LISFGCRRRQTITIFIIFYIGGLILAKYNNKKNESENTITCYGEITSTYGEFAERINEKYNLSNIIFVIKNNQSRNIEQILNIFEF
jgi:predicted permease